MLRIACSGLLALLLGCGAATEDASYLENASLNSVAVTTDYPGVVKVILPEGRGLCTGTLIAPRAVLTAAHCATETGAYRVVSSGGTKLTYQVERLGTGDLGDTRDLAVLVFSTSVGASVIPISTGTLAVGDVVRLVGFGCNDLTSRFGSGTKRTGTNRIVQRGDFLEIATPLDAPASQRRILGPENLAGSCFGDSGGPMLTYADGALRVAGVAHAGGWNQTKLISRYVDLSHQDIAGFFQTLESSYALGLYDPCLVDPESLGCHAAQASVGIMSLLVSAWHWLLQLF